MLDAAHRTIGKRTKNKTFFYFVCFLSAKVQLSFYSALIHIVALLTHITETACMAE